MKVVNMSFYHTYSAFFKFLKILDFIKGFLKILVFSQFWGQKLNILKFRDSHVVKRVILICPSLFVRFALKLYFWKIS